VRKTCQVLRSTGGYLGTWWLGGGLRIESCFLYLSLSGSVPE